jgi:hypothetical protein
MSRTFLMLAAIVLSGCNRVAKDSPVADGVRPQFGSLGLDPKLIQRAKPGDLASKAREQIFAILEKDEENWDALALSLPQPWRAIHTVGLLEAEVNNGGFHQFFWNTEGKFNDATLKDLKYIGANQFHELFASALAVYAGHDYGKEKKDSGTNWKKRFTKGYDEKRFDDLDDRFYKLKLDGDEMLGQFIKKHPELYNLKR